MLSVELSIQDDDLDFGTYRLPYTFLARSAKGLMIN